MTVPLPAAFTLRPPTTDDIHIMVELLSLTSINDTGESDVTEEEIARQFSMPGVDASEISWLVFNETEQLIGMGLTVGFPPYVQVYCQTAVHPDYRDQHLIDYLMHRNLSHAEAYIPKAPENARVEMINGVDGRNAWRQKVLVDFGFSKARGFFDMQIDMETPPPVAEFPDGLRLQPFDPDTQAHAIFDASEDAFRDHYGHIEKADRGDDAFDRWWHNITHGGNYDPSLFFVVVDGDEIAGMALCLSSQPAKPDTAYVSILGVRRPWRGRGLAKALLYHSFGEFYQRGTFKVALGVDAENLMGATKLYEKVGMRVVKESFLYSKCLREGVNLVKESLD